MASNMDIETKRRIINEIETGNKTGPELGEEAKFRLKSGLNLTEQIDKFIQNGAYDVLKDSKYFDEKYYRKNNEFIKEDEDAQEHYLKFNKTEQKATSKYFNPEWYLEHNPDLKEFMIDPLLHFILFGEEEKRRYRYRKVNFEELDIPHSYNLEETYNTIYESDIFDIEYYLKNNGTFSLEGLDPIVHYILTGADKGYNPSAEFNTNYYTRHREKNKITQNPLYHFIKYGYDLTDEAFRERFNRKEQLQERRELPTGTVVDELEHLKREVSIIIPIYNAYEETCACIRSVLLNTRCKYELILINDCSSDKRIDRLLDSLHGIKNIKIINNKTNQGFVKNVNRGMKESGTNDVILLNSDTIVTPRWLAKLKTAAYSKPTIATVTPFSNASDICVEELGATNDQRFLNKNAYQLSKINYNPYFEAPTGNGFCLYIKRGAINKLGMFDEAFGKGYGEETDFTSRALKAGWLNIRTLDTFVYHRRHASFTSEKSQQLKEKNKKIILKRYPDVYSKWDNFTGEETLTDTVKLIREKIKPYTNGETILYVTEMKNDMPVITGQFYKIAKEYETHILALSDDSIGLFTYDGISKYTCHYKKELINMQDEDEVNMIFFNMISALKYDLMYIRQFLYLLSFRYRNLSNFLKILNPLEIQTIYEGYHDDEDITGLIDRKLNPDDTLGELIEQKKNMIDLEDKKVAVYTAITGEYDQIRTPSVVNENFDYICFTDNRNMKSDFWDVRLIDETEPVGEIRKARRCKILAHEYVQEYDYSIWIDGNFDIIYDLEDYVKKYFKNNKLLAIQHEERDCIYDEAEACIKLNKDKPEIIRKQINGYHEEDFPRHHGLIASGILVRNHNDPEVINLMKQWFDEVKNKSRRDQLSFNYVCWKNNFQYDASDIYYFKNEYFFREGHITDQSTKIQYLKYDEDQKNTIEKELLKPTSIIIPIYNAYRQTRNCIESVLRNTKIPFELFLIDDNSPDNRINPLIKKYEQEHENIHVTTNIRNKGFVRNVNTGFEISENDVVILNSDTIVTPGWLSKLKMSAYTDPTIATVTPLSNNAGAYSTPITGQKNEINPEIGLDKTAKIIENLNQEKLETPTGHGFCMFIKREAIDKVGHFDLSFGRGYGEENDFSMRVKAAGFKNIIDPTTYIYHDHTASFGDEKEKLIEENNAFLRSKHPTYKEEITEFLESPAYNRIHKNIGEALENYKTAKENILYVTGYRGGEMGGDMLDLIKNMPAGYNIYVLIASGEAVTLYEVNENKDNEDPDDLPANLRQIHRYKIPEHTMEEESPEKFDLIYFNILTQLQIDTVHIHHLKNHTFDIARIAKMLEIKTVLTFNDYYLINGYKPGNKPFIKKWQVKVREMFRNCSEFTAPTQCVYNRYMKAYPMLNGRPFMIIEDGYDVKIPETIEEYNPVSEDEQIKILVVGLVDQGNGAELLFKLKEVYDKDNRIQLHFVGNQESEKYNVNRIGRTHGKYIRGHLKDVIKKVKPHLVGMFPVWEPRFSNAVPEAWECGIPVITTDRGAAYDKINQYGGGYIIDSTAAEAYDQIMKIAEDNITYANKKEEITQIDLNSTDQKVGQYLEVYKPHDHSKKNLLYVMHQGGGGTIHTTLDLIQTTSEKYNIYLLTASKFDLKLFKYVDYNTQKESDKLKPIMKWNLREPYSVEKPSIPQFREIYTFVLETLDIDLIHIRHLIRHSLDLPEIAGEMGIKVVMSFHDFYYICVSFNLIDNYLQYCGGICTPIEPGCEDSQCAITKGLGLRSTRKFVHQWREYVTEMISYCSEFITTSQSTYDLYTKFYPQLKQRPFNVIRHGRDFEEQQPDSRNEIQEDKPLKILISGNIGISKGIEYLLKLKELDVNNEIELHFLGDVNRNFFMGQLGIYHGKYQREEFNDLVREINPHCIGIFSIWPETYCHTLTEAWAAEYPVITLDVGAVGERVKQNGGGYFVSNDPGEAYRQILELKRDKTKFNEKVREVEEIRFKSVREMGEEYLDIYDRNIKKNMLYVTNRDDGEININHDLIKNLKDDYHIFTLVAGPQNMNLYTYDSDHDQLKQVKSWNVNSDSSYKSENQHIREYEEIYTEIMQAYNFDITHIESLKYHTFDMPETADKMKAGVLLTLNDYHYLSPTGKIPSGDELQTRDMKKWREDVSEMFNHCSEFTTTSTATYDKYLESYPQLELESFSIVDHGIDVKDEDTHILSKINPDEKVIKILIPEDIDSETDMKYIEKLKEFDNTKQIEFHFTGKIDRQVDPGDMGIIHADHDFDDFDKIAEEINPHFVALFLSQSRFYTYNLLNAWSSNIPVLTTPSGASAEKVEELGGGYILTDKVHEAYYQIINFYNDKENYLKVRQQTEKIKIQSTKDMADDYDKSYRNIVGE